MHRLIGSTLEIGLSAFKLKSRYFIFIHNIKVDDIFILVIKYLLFQSEVLCSDMFHDDSPVSLKYLWNVNEPQLTTVAQHPVDTWRP